MIPFTVHPIVRVTQPRFAGKLELSWLFEVCGNDLKRLGIWQANGVKKSALMAFIEDTYPWAAWEALKAELKSCIAGKSVISVRNFARHSRRVVDIRLYSVIF